MQYACIPRYGTHKPAIIYFKLKNDVISPTKIVMGSVAGAQTYMCSDTRFFFFHLYDDVYHRAHVLSVYNNSCGVYANVSWCVMPCVCVCIIIIILKLYRWKYCRQSEVHLKKNLKSVASFSLETFPRNRVFGKI